ncbi:hypothetical protein Salat_1853400 [Sesamum alatum]|uniref:Myb/SANT-like domain-containing protein n=1 Tax=Sesamum alatum TaxID=300844 RepID=A0AAE1Y2Y4_9LAMI|nr:hypothetical protein Salat_1853400 [Sesamum alatum]
MTPNALNLQRRLFYGSLWSKAMERSFLEILVEEIQVGNMVVGYPDVESISSGMVEVNGVYEKSYDYIFYEDRVRRLQERYRVFPWVKSLAAVNWNSATNEVFAEPHTWELVVQKCPLARAYVNIADPAWDELCIIFGESVTLELSDDEERTEPINHTSERVREVIDLSSGSDDGSE